MSEERYVFKWFPTSKSKSKAVGKYFLAVLPNSDIDLASVKFKDGDISEITNDDIISSEYEPKKSFKKTDENYPAPLDKITDNYKVLFNKYFQKKSLPISESTLIKTESIKNDNQDPLAINIRRNIYNYFLYPPFSHITVPKIKENIQKLVNEEISYKSLLDKLENLIIPPSSERVITVKKYTINNKILEIDKIIGSLLHAFSEYGIDKTRDYVDMFSYTSTAALNRFLYYEAILASWKKDKDTLNTIVQILDPKNKNYKNFQMGRFHKIEDMNIELQYKETSLKKLLCDDLTTRLNSRIIGSPDIDPSEQILEDPSPSLPQGPSYSLRISKRPLESALKEIKKKSETYKQLRNETTDKYFNAYTKTFNDFAVQLCPLEFENNINCANTLFKQTDSKIYCCCYICGHPIEKETPTMDHIISAQLAYTLNIQYFPLLFAPTHEICNQYKSELIAEPFDENESLTALLKTMKPSELDKRYQRALLMREYADKELTLVMEERDKKQKQGGMNGVHAVSALKVQRPSYNRKTKLNLNNRSFYRLAKSAPQNINYLKIFTETKYNLIKRYNQIFITITNTNSNKYSNDSVFILYMLRTLINFMKLEIDGLSNHQSGGSPEALGKINNLIKTFFEKIRDTLTGRESGRINPKVATFYIEGTECIHGDRDTLKHQVCYYKERMHIFAIYSYQLYMNHLGTVYPPEYTYDQYLADRVILLSKVFKVDFNPEAYPLVSDEMKEGGKGKKTQKSKAKNKGQKKTAAKVEKSDGGSGGGMCNIM